MKKVALLLIVTVVSMTSCTEMKEPVKGHFFVMNTDQRLMLSINDQQIGTLPRVNEIPVICEDSLMMLTMPVELELKRNTFQVLSQSGAVLLDGKFNLRSGSMTASGRIDSGHVYYSPHDDQLIMGFNTPTMLSIGLVEACN